MLKGIIGSLAGGAVGATLWAVVAYYTQYELGIIAALVGAACGLGMSLGTQGGAGPIGGLTACAIALLAIVVGKYTVLQFVMSSTVSSMMQSMPWTDARSKVYLAEQLVLEYEAAGKVLKWPEGVDPELATEPEEYPPDLWKDVEARWSAMTPKAQADYAAAAKAEFEQQVGNRASSFALSNFSRVFSPYDMIWATFAVLAAYRIGSGDED